MTPTGAAWGLGVGVVLLLAGCTRATGEPEAARPAAESVAPRVAATAPSPASARATAVRSRSPGSATRSPRPRSSVVSTRPPATTTPTPAFASSVSAITPAIRARMPYSWRPGCPVALADLRYLTVSYHGFDRAVHRGELVVHATQAGAVLRALHSLFDAGYPIRQMRLVDVYHADDDASVAADNTSAFNCREVAGQPGVWSQHAYGGAIDVNPLENPYVHSDGSVDLPASRPYVDRSRRATGMIHAGDATVDAFAAVGWRWGGYWGSAKDYQHFSATGR